jgi:hypothetical protein
VYPMGETAVERKATKTYTDPKEVQVLQVVKVRYLWGSSFKESTAKIANVQ